MKKYEWLEKKHLRSVDSLRLWSENPRLNPDGKYVKLLDYVEDLLSDNSEKDSFIKLLTSIADKGFLSIDPIVVWQKEGNSDLYVAEGNRRVIALKLLREPDKSPKSIRPLVRELASKMDIESIHKIYVYIAPSFEDTEWYINERHNPSSLQKSWSRIQHQRWIAHLYEKYNGNLDSILADSTVDKATVEADIRILQLLELIKLPKIKELLTEDEYEKAVSHRFPITILERFFNYTKVRDDWHITFDGAKVNVHAEMDSFCKAYAELVRRILTGEGNIKINTRMKAGDVPAILESLPTVSSSESNLVSTLPARNAKSDENSNSDLIASKVAPAPVLKNDVNRSKLILDIYTLNSEDKRLMDLFNELKQLPVNKYPTCICASMRVFLDISVRLYIEEKGWKTEITKCHKGSFNEITLQKRLSFIKDQIKTKCEEKTILERLLNPGNEYSLDVLNGYVHSSHTHYEQKQFINGFWDFMFPLFRMLVDISESTTSLEENASSNV